MSTMIQVRNVPEDVHRRVKARAALAGMSMSEYILRQLQSSLNRPTRAEILDRLAELPEADLEPSPAEMVRQLRDSR